MIDIYILGPHNAPTPEEIAENVLNAQAITIAILKLGGHPRCPHVISHGVGHLLPESHWLREGLYMMSQCSAAIRLPWCERVAASRGTAAEWAFGHELGLDMHEALAISPDPFVSLPTKLIALIRGEGLD
jgi:hypothetical protein